MSHHKIIYGDCIELMPEIPNKSIDMILCDLPYGTTVNSWDNIIPFEPLWIQYERIIKDNGAIVLFGSQPFTTDLINSNRKLFRYELIWEKLPTGFLGAKRRPLKTHENILVFYKKQPTYNYQEFTTKVNKLCMRPSNNKSGRNWGYIPHGEKYIQTDEDYPTTILNIPNPNIKTIHPTQKPIALFECVITAYTNKNNLVLDNCVGSGTTLVACERLKRNSIGIELSKEYCELAFERLSEAVGQTKLSGEQSTIKKEGF